MQSEVDVPLLLEAARTNLVDFKFLPNSPVILPTIDSLPLEISNQVISRYLRHGFSVVHFESLQPTAETVVSLANLFDLGDPFIPPLYTLEGYNSGAISKVSTQNSPSAHPTFQQEVEIKFHCDGTLQKIGYVKTSILLCETAGSEGGDSILFNATAAYAELLCSDLDAAIAMATPGSLVRQANMNGCSEKNKGPVFSLEDGMLICAYSVTETDRFVASDNINADDLGRGVEFMRKAAEPGSPYFHKLRLEANQAIIFANSRVSHGRTAYRDLGNVRRCLYRGLFSRYPKVKLEKQLKIAV
jgi:alpha-ketoglutarate-dependent taurine dioxygenase